MNTMEKCFVYIIWFYNLIHSLDDEEWCDIAIRIPDLWAMAKGRRDDFSVETE